MILLIPCKFPTWAVSLIRRAVCLLDFAHWAKFYMEGNPAGEAKGIIAAEITIVSGRLLSALAVHRR